MAGVLFSTFLCCVVLLCVAFYYRRRVNRLKSELAYVTYTAERMTPEHHLDNSTYQANYQATPDCGAVSNVQTLLPNNIKFVNNDLSSTNSFTSNSIGNLPVGIGAAGPSGVQAVCTLSHTKNSNVERAKIGEDSYYATMGRAQHFQQQQRHGSDGSGGRGGSKKGCCSTTLPRSGQQGTFGLNTASGGEEYAARKSKELDFRPNIYQSIDDLKTLTKEPFYCEVRDGKSTMSKDEDISNQLEASNCAAGEGECSNARESRQRGSTSTLRSTDENNEYSSKLTLKAEKYYGVVLKKGEDPKV